jgi:hypothetical protein
MTRAFAPQAGIDAGAGDDVLKFFAAAFVGVLGPGIRVGRN